MLPMCSTTRPHELSSIAIHRLVVDFLKRTGNIRERAKSPFHPRLWTPWKPTLCHRSLLLLIPDCRSGIRSPTAGQVTVPVGPVYPV